MSAVVETTSEPFLVLESDLRIAMANEAFLKAFRVETEETEGEFLFDLGNGQWDIPELRQLLTRLVDGTGKISGYRVEHDFETIGRRSMLLNARKLRQERHERILLTISDNTQRERFEKELEARREFGDKLIDSIREGLIVLKPDMTVERVNYSFCTMFRVEPEETEGRNLFDLGNGQWDIPELHEALKCILPQAHSFDDYEVTHDFPDVGRRTMLLNARRLDHMPRILLAIRDETDRARHEEEQKLLIGEIQHRVKNILGNVQSIANATLRRSSSIDQFGEAFQERLQSLARAQDLVMRGAKGVVELEKLVVFELQAHGWEVDGRLAITGPKVVLTRDQTQSVAVVLHELTTNAVKYGAFSVPSGRLDVKWTVDEERWLRFDWRESGVALAGPPKKKGFGTGMIERSIGHSLGGESKLEFTNEGAACHFAFPLEQSIQGGA